MTNKDQKKEKMNFKSVKGEKWGRKEGKNEGIQINGENNNDLKEEMLSKEIEGQMKRCENEEKVIKN